MDEVYGPRSAMISAQAWEIGKLKAEVFRLQTALADATERAEAAEGYIAKIEAIRGKKLGVPCCCDFADDDNETPIVECGYHRAVREERDAATERAEANATEVHLLGERVRIECERRDQARRERDAAIVRADALAARLAEVDDREHPA